MRIVTRQARERAIAVAETGRAVQVRGLVPHVPGIAPIPVIVQIARLAMAGAAEGIELDRRQPPGILYRRRAARLRMRAPRPMARLAMYSRLAGLDLKTGRERDRPGRVTTEAAQRGGDRVEGAVDQIRGGRVPWCQSE
jgi:hypothetical protein